MKKMLDVVKLTPLMDLTSGRPEIIVGLIDGPVVMNHPDLAIENIREIYGKSGACAQASSAACMHGTFVAGILCGKRGSLAPAICPGCTLLVRPIFGEASVDRGKMPSATPEELAEAIMECIDGGARVINLSVALSQPSSRGEHKLEDALDYAARRGVIAVAASGNQGTVGSSAITRHSWVIPVVACDSQGRPVNLSNLGSSIGRQGLCAPGDEVTSLGAEGKSLTLRGTSVAAPFVTGAIALLWSEFPDATATEVKLAITQARVQRPTTVVPPLLDAWAAYQVMAKTRSQGYSKQFIIAKGGKNFMEQIDVNKPLVDKSGELNAVTALSPERREDVVLPQQQGGATTDGEAPRMKTGCGGTGKPGTSAPCIYAMGRIKIRFPTLGVEKEYAHALARAGKETAGLTDQNVQYAILKDPTNRYLVSQLCWVLAIEGVDTYILQPRDPVDLTQLVEAIRPAPSLMDVDVVIGVKGPIAPSEMCNGLLVPIVGFDQIYSFDRPKFLEALKEKRPETMSEEEFTATAEEVLDRIMQMADNAGATDEHRALNYLALNSVSIYAKTVEMHQRNFSLTEVRAGTSRLSSARKIVDPNFYYTNRETQEVVKYFVRVDVTEEFPFLVTALSQSFDR